MVLGFIEADLRVAASALRLQSLNCPRSDRQGSAGSSTQARDHERLVERRHRRHFHDISTIRHAEKLSCDKELADLSIVIAMINAWNRLAIGARSAHPADRAKAA